MKKQPPRRANVSSTSIRQQILEQLTRAGFSVTLAPRLSEALAAVQDHSRLLVILDLMDPQTGAQLVEELRAQKPVNQQPVVLLSPVEDTPKERQLL